MATKQVSVSKSKTSSRSFTRALALAFNEWLLMLMLFVNSIFSFVITKFADYSELQTPCMMCSRLDHILGRTKHLKKSHWDMICSKHKSEISSLVYCHAHGKLVDVRGICETCLFSFTTTNKTNAETYRLLVGKLGEDSSCFELKSDQSTVSRYCTCCNQLWIPQTATRVAKPELLTKIRTGKQSTPKKSVRFNHMPHVGYSELKIQSDTESETLFSEDEGVVVKDDDKFRTVKLENLPVISLPYDLATDKLLNLDYHPLVEKVHGVPETSSQKVLKKEEMVLSDNLFLISRAMEPSATVLKEEQEDLIHLQDVILTPDLRETPAEALMEETELIPVNRAPETSEKVLKKEEIVLLDHLFVASRTMEASATILKEEQEDLIHLQDVILTPKIPENFLMDETELIPVNRAPETSRAMEHSAAVPKEQEDLIQLQDSSSTPDIKEVPVTLLKEKTEIICLSDVISTPNSAETPEDVLMEEAVLKEKEELICRQDVSITPDFKGITALMEETELISLNDVTSTPVAAETPEDVLKGTELMSLHEISLDEVSESFNTTEIYAETSNESHTNRAEPTSGSVESEDIVVSSSDKSMPENSTENCVLENKEMEETSLKVSSVSEISLPANTSHTEVALESELSETNLDSGESWMQGGELVDLADAYNIIVSNDSNRDNNGGAEIEKRMKKDTCRVSEDLKALLTQISASRGIEFLSPRDISPKICNDQETKSLDHEMQLLIQKRMLERNESNLSLEGVAVSEIEGESESDRLKRQVDQDRKLLTGLYKELEEERSASAIATNQAMAMITRLQEEKALFQMEALQNLRMMEEQAEYDMEAIQKLNDLLVDREKAIQDLEAEIDYLRDQTPQKNKLDVAENVTEIDYLHDQTQKNKLDVAENVTEIDYLRDQTTKNKLDVAENVTEIDYLQDQALQKNKFDVAENATEIDYLHDQTSKNKLDVAENVTEIDYLRDQTLQKNKFDVAENVTEIDFLHDQTPKNKFDVAVTEIDYLHDQTLQKNNLEDAENVTEMQRCLTGFDEERLYITNCLEKIENRVQKDVNGDFDNQVTEESVSELHKRVEMLKGDLYFIEHVVNSLGHGNEGMKFVKEIASHLQTLRNLRQVRVDVV